MPREGRVLLTLPDDYYTQIGAIMFKWATLEFQLMAIIWRAMDLENEDGRVLTVGMNTPTLCGILRNLPKKWITDEAVKDAVRRLAKAIGEHVNTRNYLAHGMWTIYPNDPYPYLNFMKEADHRLMPAAQAIKPNDLQNFSLVLDQLNLLASQIVGSLMVRAEPPLPNTPGEQNPAGLPTQTQTP